MTPRLLSAWLLLAALLGISPAYAAHTERISVSSTGEEADDLAAVWTVGTPVSADGRYVTFTSCASNLADNGPPAAGGGIYVRDRLDGYTYCATVSPTGAAANSCSSLASISDDGRYVAFWSHASNLVAGDMNGCADVFVRDLLSGTTEIVSVSSSGQLGNYSSSRPAISPDARYVFFYSEATNLVPAGPQWGLYVRDRQLNVTALLYQGHPWVSDITSDGEFAAFATNDDSLVPWDTNECRDAFVAETSSGIVERVSVGTLEEQGIGESIDPSVSDDGRYVAFESSAENLVPDDTNGYGDIFLRDRELGTTERINLTPEGHQVCAESGSPRISRDGRYVMFWSGADSLVSGHTDWWADIFVWDREAAVTELVSVSTAGEQGNGDSLYGDLSADGRFVVFTSDASNLVAGDTNGCQDVFIRDRETFLDIPLEHWSYYAVSACYNAGIVAGYPDGQYHPELPVTRDQMAVYVARGIAGGDDAVPSGPPDPTFSDMPQGVWAYKHVEYAAAQSVVEGYADGQYHPEYDVDRGQMAVYVARARGWVDITDDMATAPELFPDVPAGYWSGTAIEACVTSDVVQGYPDGLYRPEATVTRDQMAVYIARAFELY